MSAEKTPPHTPTPGPWTARVSAVGHQPPHVVAIYQDEQDRRCTAFVAICDSTTLDNAANALLIAATPDLLSALRALVAGVERDDNPRDEGHDSDSDEMTQARAALAKAEAGREGQ